MIETRELNRLVDVAQKQVAGILADLEVRTGCHVDSLSIENVDVTKMGSISREVVRGVRIVLRHPPGSSCERDPK